MKPLIHHLLAATLAVVGPAAVFGQAYHANDVTPKTALRSTLSAIAAGQAVGQSYHVTPSNLGHKYAMILAGSPLAPVDLDPIDPVWSETMATSTDGTQQGGWGYLGYGWTHALLWNGSATGFIDLHADRPTVNGNSFCLGVHNGEQVGYIAGDQAVLWRGSAASRVYLHAFTSGVDAHNLSRALGVHDGEQVGYIARLPDTYVLTGKRAVRWHGTPESEVDLHPAGYDESAANCTTGIQQAGWGRFPVTGTYGYLHALLWSGDAASVVDLHPAGFEASTVVAMNATQQVGTGTIRLPGGTDVSYPRMYRALLWSGTAESAVDLEQFLPSGYTNLVVTGIDADGVIVGSATRVATYFDPGTPPQSSTESIMLIPGPRPAGQVESVTFASHEVPPGATVTGVVSIQGPAPAGGVNLTLECSSPALATLPTAVTIPEGESSVTFPITVGGDTLIRPQSLKIFASDATVSPVGVLTIVPVVQLDDLGSVTVEGGYSTTGWVSLNLPASYPQAVVALSSGNPNLVTVPNTVSFSYFDTFAPYTKTFAIQTAPVAVTTVVPITASFNGSTWTANVTLTPAPPIAITGLSAPEVVGGYTMPVTVVVDNFPRAAAGVVISLSSSDPATLQIPATATIAQGTFSATVTAASAVVTKRKAVTLTATFNGTTLSTTAFVNPVPTVSIQHADYFTDTHEFRLDATTTFTNATMTFGTSPSAAPLGTMVFEAGLFKASMILPTAPTQATVWNSFGGQSTVSVRLRTTATTTTTATYKLSVATSGKGTVTVTPAATAYAAGTVVTLTATPAAGSPWVGWSGDATGSANPLTITISRDMKVTANFR